MYDHMCTYTGRMVAPLEIREEDIRLEDVAHCLSLLCRGSGHLRYFYSVGQHCLNCAREARARGWADRLVLGCLIHDASEAYVSDITRPVKKHLPNYIEMENKMLDIIFRSFGLEDLTKEDHALIKQIDNEMLENELPALMNIGESGDAPAPLKAEADFTERDMREVEREYLSMARELLGKI